MQTVAALFLVGVGLIISGFVFLAGCLCLKGAKKEYTERHNKDKGEDAKEEEQEGGNKEEK